MPDLIDKLFGEALTFRKKFNKTGNLRAIAGRVSRGAPEVMVKITGFGKGVAHVKSHLNYISRQGKVDLETDDGEILHDKEAIAQHFGIWKDEMEGGKQRKNRRDTMHLVLSMPKHVDEESVQRATREFTRETFGENHRYLFALHTDGANPHCHVTVLCDGRNGRKLNPRKADLQAWREAFAEKIRDQGYEAEATPRRARGIVRKAEKTVIRHIEKGDKTHRPRVSRVRAARIKEAAMDLAQKNRAPDRPWETATEARQIKVRKSWLDAADALEKQNTSESADLSVRIRTMVANMPPVETARQRTANELKQLFNIKSEKERPPQPEAKKVLPNEKDRDWER